MLLWLFVLLWLAALQGTRTLRCDWKASCIMHLLYVSSTVSLS